MSSTELGAFNFDDLPDVDLTDLEVSPGARVPDSPATSASCPTRRVGCCRICSRAAI